MSLLTTCTLLRGRRRNSIQRSNSFKPSAGVDQLVPKVALRNLQWIENEVLAKESTRPVTEDEKCWKFPIKPDPTPRRRLCGRSGLALRTSRKPNLRPEHEKYKAAEEDMPAWQKKFVGDKVEEGEDLVHNGKPVMKKGRPNDRQKTLHNQGYVPRKCCRPQCLRRETTHGQFESCPYCKQAVYCSPRCFKLDWESPNYFNGDRMHSHKAECQRDRVLEPRENEDHKVSFENLASDRHKLPSGTLNIVAHPDPHTLRGPNHYSRATITPRGARKPTETIAIDCSSCKQPRTPR